jgi:hypothetical protein
MDYEHFPALQNMPRSWRGFLFMLCFCDAYDLKIGIPRRPLPPFLIIFSTWSRWDAVKIGLEYCIGVRKEERLDEEHAWCAV